MESQLWIPSKEEVWELGVITSLSDDSVTVQTLLEGKTVTLKKADTHLLDESHLGSLDDLCQMNNLHEGPLLQMLRRRLLNNQIYTYSSDVLISVNPYATIPGLYDEPLRYLAPTDDDDEDEDDETKMRVRNTALPPHVYEIAHNALRELTRERKPSAGPAPSQSIIVSGESGAGKTEASKHAMQFLIKANEATCALAEQGRGGGGGGGGVSGGQGNGAMTDLGSVAGVLLQSSVAFESFGNAQTVRNDNSSRFGKYIKLQYTSDGLLAAAETETFLLEKSRLVSVGRGERNYHVFYQLLCGLDAASKQALCLGGGVGQFKILAAEGDAGPSPQAAAADKEGFDALSAALTALGCSQLELSAIWALLAALLHLGNVSCRRVSDNEDEVCEVSCSSVPLAALASMLGVPEGTFLLNLRTQSLQAARRTSVSKKVLSPEDTQNNVLATLKTVYKGLFSWLLAKVNLAHGSTSLAPAGAFIGILDIFGFEILQTNSFEQLCINYTNERLQQQFNEHIFVLEQREYAAEGLDWRGVTYRDNQAVIELIGKRPAGLLLILEEHSMMNRRPDDKALGNSFLTAHGKAPAVHPAFSKSKFGNEGFVVRHFAGDVSYDLEGFVAKNNDSLQEDLSDLLATSSNSLLRAATGLGAVEPHEVGFVRPAASAAAAAAASAEEEEGGEGGGKRMASSVTVSFQFRQQLDLLVRSLKTTRPHYIKCIKSNAAKAAASFACPLVMEQLRYSGIIEVVRIRREGYPVRMSFRLFYAKHAVLAFARGWLGPEDPSLGEAAAKEYCLALAAAELLPGTYQAGTARMFLMDGCLDRMQGAILRFLSSYAVKIQACRRRQVQRKRFLFEVVRIVKAQAALRMFLRRGQFKRHVFDRKAAEAAVEAERRRLEALRLREAAERAEEERLAKLEHAARVQALAEMERAKAERRALEEAKAAVLQRTVRALLARRRSSKRTEEVHKAAASGDVAALKAASAWDLALLQSVPSVHCPWPLQFTAVLNNQVTALRQLGWGRPAGHSAQTVLSMRDGRGNSPLHIACSATPLKDATIVALCEACDALIPPSAAPPKLGGAADKSLISSLAPRARSDPLKSGWLSKKKEGNAWRRRWCVLTEDQLVYYKTPQDNVPKGTVPLLGCTFSRRMGPAAEGPSFELRSPHIKKSSFFGLGAGCGSPMAVQGIYFLAETEADLLQWMTPARALLGVEPLRQGKVTYADNARRGAVINAGAVNHLGQTALHLLAAQKTADSAQEQAELLTTAAWVVSLGCPPDRQALDGRSAAQVAAENGHPSLRDFLQLATAESFSAATGQGLMPRPVFYKGYSYLQLTFLTHAMRPGGSPAFKPAAQPSITVDVLSGPAGKAASLEAGQTLTGPFYCHANGATLWWGQRLYVQTPLENMADGAKVSLKLVPGSSGGVGVAPLASASLSLSRRTLDSGRVVLELQQQDGRPHSHLHVEVALLCL